jgi:hypothetical protein
MTAPRILFLIALLVAAWNGPLVPAAQAARSDARASRPAHAAAPPVSAEAEAASLERLRERLAEKLGATPAPGSTDPNVLRVVNKPAAPASAAR